MLAGKSRTKRPRNTKICTKVAHPTGNNTTTTSEKVYDSVISSDCVVMDRVYLEKEDPSTLRVTGIIVDSTLQLLTYENDMPLKCINFDKTYFGTDVIRSAVLFNNSPEPMRFVMILNDTAEGQVKV